MRINGKIILDKLIWLVTAFLFFSITAFVNATWGRYVLLGAALLVICLAALRSKGVLRLQFNAWHGFFLAFVAYCAVTSLWALHSGDPKSKSVSFFLMLVCFSLVYIPFQEKSTVGDMFSIVKWGGFAVTIYAFAYYGYDNIVDMMSEGIRLSNELINANSLGMLAAIPVVMQVYEITRKRKINFSLLFCIPSVIMVAATQSRKALLLAVIGAVLVILSNNLGKGKNGGRFLKGICSVAIVLAAIYAVLQLPFFAGVMERMETFTTLFTGDGAGASSQIRNQMINLGWETFLKNPIGGVGIGCPHILAKHQLGFDAYLHNNFVELLCGGGIVGFGVFYGMYIYLFYNMYKYRKFKDEWYWLCLIMMVLLLIMDYAMVSAYEKNTWFYFMIFFLEVRNLKQRSRAHAVEQIMESGKAVSER